MAGVSSVYLNGSLRNNEFVNDDFLEFTLCKREVFSALGLVESIDLAANFAKTCFDGTFARTLQLFIATVWEEVKLTAEDCSDAHFDVVLNKNEEA